MMLLLMDQLKHCPVQEDEMGLLEFISISLLIVCFFFSHLLTFCFLLYTEVTLALMVPLQRRAPQHSSVLTYL